MRNLKRDLASCSMNLIRHLLEMRYMIIGIDAELSWCRDTLSSHARMAGNDEPYFPSRKIDQQLGKCFGRVTLRCGQSFPGSGPYETIGQRHAVEYCRFEKLCHASSFYGSGSDDGAPTDIL